MEHNNHVSKKKKGRMNGGTHFTDARKTTTTKMYR